jgi:tRNA-dihydrouridine synthase A
MTAIFTTSTDTHRFCVAPMMDCTDRHCRYFLRLLSKKALLYTEMVTTGALLHGEPGRFLRHDPKEQPLALQLGGSNPNELARCSKMAEEAGYVEVNLNVGCPSDRVQNNKIGACLMAEPELVAECVAAMRAATPVRITVKCRTGIDKMDSYEELAAFIDTVSTQSGCATFIVHARIALLQGLSPKANREIPPLDYARVYKLKKDFPQLEIVINGGIRTLPECKTHLGYVDGVMLGREAYQNPFLLHDVDKELFGFTGNDSSRVQILEQFFPYLETQLHESAALHHMTRHILGLFHGQTGGKRFRRYLSENVHKPEASLGILHEALAHMTNHNTDEQELTSHDDRHH